MGKHYEKILQYLSGELPESELLAFQQQLQKDPLLETELKEVMRLREQVEMQHKSSDGEGKLKAILGDLGEQYFDESKAASIEGEESPSDPSANRLDGNKGGRVSKLKWLPILAAACLLVLGLCGTSYWLEQNYGQERLASSYWQDIGSLERSAKEPIVGEENADERNHLNQELIRAEQLFLSGQYEQSLTLLKQIEKATGNPKYDSSKINIERLQWNRVLCYVAKGEDLKAKSKAQMILKTPGSKKYKQLAEELLKDLESPFFGLAN